MQHPDIVSVGDFFFKTNHIRRIFLYLHNKYPADIPGSLQAYNELPPSDKKRADYLMKANAREILWIYEGNYLYTRCLRLLSIRPRSEKELKDFIRRYTDNDQSAELVLEKLQVCIDDKSFALYLTQKERNHNPKGDTIIAMKLSQKGVDAEIISEVLAGGDCTQVEYIDKQYRKKQDIFLQKAQKKGSKWKQEYRKLMVYYLLSKGFSMSDINKYLTDVLRNETEYTTTDF